MIDAAEGRAALISHVLKSERMDARCQHSEIPALRRRIWVTVKSESISLFVSVICFVSIVSNVLLVLPSSQGGREVAVQVSGISWKWSLCDITKGPLLEACMCVCAQFLRRNLRVTG